MSFEDFSSGQRLSIPVLKLQLVFRAANFTQEFSQYIHKLHSLDLARAIVNINGMPFAVVQDNKD